MIHYWIYIYIWSTDLQITVFQIQILYLFNKKNKIIIVKRTCMSRHKYDTTNKRNEPVRVDNE